MANRTPSATLLIGAQGTPAAISASYHSWRVRPASAATSSGRSSARLAVRSWFRRNRGSATSSSTPSTLHSRANWPSLPAMTISSPSAVGSGSYGKRLGCALPMRCGTAPPATYALVWLTSPESAADMRSTSTRWPRPVRSRSRSAARIPMAVCIPDMTSKTDIPARYGGPSGSPVRLIRPDIACTMRS